MSGELCKEWGESWGLCCLLSRLLVKNVVVAGDDRPLES